MGLQRLWKPEQPCCTGMGDVGAGDGRHGVVHGQLPQHGGEQLRKHESSDADVVALQDAAGTEVE